MENTHLLQKKMIIWKFETESKREYVKILDTFVLSINSSRGGSLERKCDTYAK